MKKILLPLLGSGLFLAAACAPDLRQGSPADDPAAEFLRVLAEYRVFEARPGFPSSHAPCLPSAIAESPSGTRPCARLPAPGSDPFQRLARLVPRVRSAVRTNPSGAALRALAMAEAAWAGDNLLAYDRSLDLLARALELAGAEAGVADPGVAEAGVADPRSRPGAEPRSRPGAQGGPGQGRAAAEVLTDRSAVHIARFGASRDPRDLIAAASYAERALERDPDFAPALFDRALALHKLYLTHQARRAWTSFLEEAADPGWTAEARGRRSWLAIGAGEFSPRSLRERALDELLPAWGRARLAGARGAARDDLALLHGAGERLASEAGYSGVQYLVAAIESVGDGPDSRRLAEGLRDFGVGRRLFSEGRYQASYPYFLRAERAAAQAGIPFPWPSLWAAAVQMYRADYESSDRRLRAALDSVVAQPAADALARTVLGISLERRGRLEAAVRQFERAATTYRLAGDRASLAGAYANLADAYRFLGEERRSLEHVRRALEILVVAPDPSIRYGLLLVTGQQLSRQYPRVAVHFHEEGLAVARGMDNPQRSMAALIRMARAQVRATDTAAAERTLELARDGLPRLSDSIMRPRLEAELQQAAGTIWARSDPARAREALSGAVSFYREKNIRLNLIPLLRLRAVSSLRTGEHDRGERDLREAIALIEEGRATTRDPALRGSLMDAAAGAYDALIAFEVGRRRPLAALDLLERSRASLWRLSGALSTPPDSDEEGWRGRVPEGITLIEYAVLPKRLLVWVVRGKGVAFAEVPVSSAELAEAVREFGVLLRRGGDPDAVESLAVRLHDWLLEPVSGALPPRGEFVIVPDRALHGLPFAALVHPASGQFLVERHAVRYSPSLRLAIRGPREISADGVEPGLDALIVSAPAFDRDMHPELARLEAAAGGSRTVARLLGGVRRLMGARATPSAVVDRLDEVTLFHFAGHARYSSERPERSHLVLAPEGSVGNGGSSGAGHSRDVLMAADISSLDLRGLRLAVLPACSTMVPGETRTGGLSGLARAFLAAGAGGVVGSLWPVRDRAAAELMAEFYRGLISGLAPANALRAAQLEFIRSGRADRRLPGVWSVFRYEGV